MRSPWTARVSQFWCGEQRTICRQYGPQTVELSRFSATGVEPRIYGLWLSRMENLKASLPSYEPASGTLSIWASPAMGSYFYGTRNADQGCVRRRDEPRHARGRCEAEAIVRSSSSARIRAPPGHRTDVPLHSFEARIV